MSAEAAGGEGRISSGSTGPAKGTGLLCTKDVIAGYLPEVDILNGVSIDVGEGEIVTIVGPNGAGKSTLIKTIFGLLSPRSGNVRFGDTELVGRKPHDITRLGLSYVSQMDNVFPTLTVEENLEMGSLDKSTTKGQMERMYELFPRLGETELSGKKPHDITRLGLSYVSQMDNVFPTLTVEENLEMGSLDKSTTKGQMERMYELFPRLGERRSQPAGTMSGGERQMVAMGRALMPDPKVLLLDEPSAGLAPAFVDAIFEKTAEINKAGVTILMVEQNARRALEMSNRGYVLDLGQDRFEGPGQDLLDDPKVAELYLGGTARIDEAQS